MPVTHLAGRQARIDVSLDGIRFTRSDSDAGRRNTVRVRDLEWDQVLGASVQSSGKGRPVIRVAVVGAREVADHRHDPNSLTLGRDHEAAARRMVADINAEVAVRDRWRQEQARSSG